MAEYDWFARQLLGQQALNAEQQQMHAAARQQAIGQGFGPGLASGMYAPSFFSTATTLAIPAATAILGPEAMAPVRPAPRQAAQACVRCDSPRGFFPTCDRCGASEWTTAIKASQ